MGAGGSCSRYRKFRKVGRMKTIIYIDTDSFSKKGMRNDEKFILNSEWDMPRMNVSDVFTFDCDDCAKYVLRVVNVSYTASIIGFYPDRDYDAERNYYQEIVCEIV
jgi:hypothetical protein